MDRMTLDGLTTVKSGQAYRAVIGGTVHFFEVDQHNTGVFVRTLAGNLGGYKLHRFGGTLTPNTLRAFLWLTWNLDVGTIGTMTPRELSELVNTRDAIRYTCVDAYSRTATCRECGHVMGPYARQGRTDSPELSLEAFGHAAVHVLADWRGKRVA